MHTRRARRRGARDGDVWAAGSAGIDDGDGSVGGCGVHEYVPGGEEWAAAEGCAGGHDGREGVADEYGLRTGGRGDMGGERGRYGHAGGYWTVEGRGKGGVMTMQWYRSRGITRRCGGRSKFVPALAFYTSAQTGVGDNTYCTQVEKAEPSDSYDRNRRKLRVKRNI